MSSRKKERLSTGRITGRGTPFQQLPGGGDMAVGAEERRSKSVEPGMMSSSPSRRSAQRQPSADVWQRKTGREAAGGSRGWTNRSGGLTGRSASTTGEVDVAKGLHNLAITRQKINESVGGIRKYFRKFNTNKNGILTREELHDGFHRLGMGITHEDIHFLVNSFDLDGSNDIEYNEFAQTLALSDPEMVTKVLAYNAKHVPEWQKPKHWHFTPADESKAEELRTTIRERLWASYGDDPMAMRKAFLDLDSDRAGVLDQQDMAHSLKKVGLEIPDKDLKTLLAYYDNRGQEGGFSFHTFLKIFGPEVAGKFNPFRVDPVFPKTPPSTQPTERGMSGPEVGVADRWLDSFGRDRRSKTVFPEVYHSSIKKNERPAKDFSERPDVQDYDKWRLLGKVVGGDVVTPAYSTSPSRREHMMRMRSGSSTPTAVSPNRGGGNFFPASPVSNMVMRQTTKGELKMDREARLEQRRSEVTNNRAAAARMLAEIEAARQAAEGAPESSQ